MLRFKIVRKRTLVVGSSSDPIVKANTRFINITVGGNVKLSN